MPTHSSNLWVESLVFRALMVNAIVKTPGEQIIPGNEKA